MASKQEILERQDDIMGMLLRGNSTINIIKIIQSQYGVSKATIERDVSKCYDIIRKNYERDISDVISTHIGKYEEIHRAAMGLGDFRSAIQSLQAIEKLLKLHVDQPLVSLQQNNLNLNLEKVSYKELRELLYSNE
jgi:hypothetical protein